MAGNPAPWIAAAASLHRSEQINTDVYWYFVMLFVEDRIGDLHDVDPELVRLSAEMVAIEAAHGLEEDDSFLVSEAPADWRALGAAWDRRAHAIQSEYLRAHGFDDVAALFESNFELMGQRADVGRLLVWPDDDLGDALGSSAFN